MLPLLPEARAAEPIPIGEIDSRTGILAAQAAQRTLLDLGQETSE